MWRLSLRWAVRLSACGKGTYGLSGRLGKAVVRVVPAQVRASVVKADAARGRVGDGQIWLHRPTKLRTAHQSVRAGVWVAAGRVWVAVVRVWDEAGVWDGTGRVKARPGTMRTGRVAAGRVQASVVEPWEVEGSVGGWAPAVRVWAEAVRAWAVAVRAWVPVGRGWVPAG